MPEETFAHGVAYFGVYASGIYYITLNYNCNFGSKYCHQIHVMHAECFCWDFTLKLKRFECKLFVEDKVLDVFDIKRSFEDS